MNTSPTNNVQLTFEQLQQIDMFEKRLGNLQNEVNLAVKQLSVARTDCDRIFKEKEYQEKILTSLIGDVNNAKSELVIVISSLESNKVELSKTVESHRELHEELSKREVTVQKKESNLDSKLKEHESLTKVFNSQSKQLEQDRNAVEAAQEAFVTATKYITWK